MLRKDSLVRGAFILAAGALLSRLLGGLYRFVLPAIMGSGEQGAYGVALFGYAYDVYIIGLTISTIGLPLAVSKLISERLARNDPVEAGQVFAASRSLLGALGLLLTGLMFAAAPVFARNVDPNALYSIYAISPAVFFVALMSSYRGLFQGLQVMTPFAVSQVIEQVVRVATILIGAALLLRYGLAYAAAGASFGAVTGAVAALLYLLFLFRRHRRELDPLLPRAGARQGAGSLPIMRELLALAIPISLAGLSYPLFRLVDLLVPVRLQMIGLSVEEASKAYGALTQEAAPFLNVPLSFTTGFALSLVPAISEAAAVGNWTRVQKGTGTALRVALSITLPAVVGLMVLSHDLADAVYGYPEVGPLLRTLAAAALFIGIQQMSSGVLQGLGQPMVPVRNLVAGVVVKAAMTWVLVGMPRWGAQGAALAWVVGFGISSVLNLFSVRARAGGLGLTLGHVLRPAAAALLMGAAVAWLQPMVVPVLGLLPATLAVVGVGAGLYGLALLAVGGVRAEDLEMAPGLARRVLPWLRRLRLIRD